MYVTKVLLQEATVSSYYYNSNVDDLTAVRNVAVRAKVTKIW